MISDNRKRLLSYYQEDNIKLIVLEVWTEIRTDSINLSVASYNLIAGNKKSNSGWLS